MNEQLISYIRAQSAAGVPTEAIKQALQTSGWRAEDVAAAFASLMAPLPQQPVVPPPAPAAPVIPVIPASPVSPTAPVSAPVQQAATMGPRPRNRALIVTASIIIVLVVIAAVMFGVPSIRAAIMSYFSPAAPAPIAPTLPVVPPPPAEITFEQASSTCTAFLSKLSATTTTPTLTLGATDANTNGEVTWLQTMLAYNKKDYPGFQVTGTYDEATQRAVDWMESQSSSTPIKDSYGKLVPVDLPGTFGLHGQALISTSCKTVQTPPVAGPVATTTATTSASKPASTKPVP